MCQPVYTRGMPFIRQHSASIVIVLVSALALALYAGYVMAQGFLAERELERTNRNVQRLSDVQAAQQSLLEYKKTHAEYPEPKTPEMYDALKNVPSAARQENQYTYVSDKEHFAFCAPLEEPGEAKAVFVTDAGGFSANQQVCTEQLSAERADVIARSGLNVEHASNFLDPTLAFSLTDKETVRSKCASSSDAKTVLYGCYVNPPPTIYVIDITDPAVSGETYVVAIHEYLHAIYSALPDEEKAKVKPLLDAELRRPQQAFLRDELDPYTEEQKYDELFARMGTESESLDSPMEEVYSKYFVNRPRLVAYHGPFREINERLQTLSARLTVLKADADRLKASGDIEGYNALVDPYNDRVAEYNELSDKHNLITK